MPAPASVLNWQARSLLHELFFRPLDAHIPLYVAIGTWKAGDCFDLSIALASLLIGVGAWAQMKWPATLRTFLCNCRVGVAGHKLVKLWAKATMLIVSADLRQGSLQLVSRPVFTAGPVLCSIIEPFYNETAGDPTGSMNTTDHSFFLTQTLSATLCVD